VKEKKAVDVLVERGMSHNQKIVMKGEADQQVSRINIFFILWIPYFGSDYQGLVTRWLTCP
jgi:hypothetical protein